MKHTTKICLILGILMLAVIIFMVFMIIVIAHNTDQMKKCHDLPVGYFRGIKIDFSFLGIDWKNCYIQLDYDKFVRYEKVISK